MPSKKEAKTCEGHPERSEGSATLSTVSPVVILNEVKDDSHNLVRLLFHLLFLSPSETLLPEMDWLLAGPVWSATGYNLHEMFTCEEES